MKPIFGQRGENVVGGDSLTPQYPSSAFSMETEHYLWEGHSEIFTKSAVVVPK